MIDVIPTAPVGAAAPQSAAPANQPEQKSSEEAPKPRRIIQKLNTEENHAVSNDSAITELLKIFDGKIYMIEKDVATPDDAPAAPTVHIHIDSDDEEEIA